jgi:hypothetical protein
MEPKDAVRGKEREKGSTLNAADDWTRRRERRREKELALVKKTLMFKNRFFLPRLRLCYVIQCYKQNIAEHLCFKCSCQSIPPKI